MPSAAHLSCPRCGEILLRYQVLRLIRDVPGSIPYLRDRAP